MILCALPIAFMSAYGERLIQIGVRGRVYTICVFVPAGALYWQLWCGFSCIFKAILTSSLLVCFRLRDPADKPVGLRVLVHFFAPSLVHSVTLCLGCSVMYRLGRSGWRDHQLFMAIPFHHIVCHIGRI